MKQLWALLYGMGGAAFVIFIAVMLAHSLGYLVASPGTDQIELASLLLAAATLIVTTLGIFLAVAAVVGYTALREAATNAGRNAGADAAQKLLEEMVQREVALRMAATQGPDRTDELTAALAAGGNENVRTPQN